MKRSISRKFLIAAFIAIVSIFAWVATMDLSDAATAEMTYYDQYGENVSDISTSVTVGRYYVIEEPTWYTPEYTFMEWNTEQDGSGRAYYPGQLLIFNDPLTLYAIMMSTPDGVYKVTYHTYCERTVSESTVRYSGTGTENYYPTDSDRYIEDVCSVRLLGSEIQLTYPAGATHTVLANRLTNSGMTFVHWNLLPEDTSRIYNAGNTLKVNSDVDLYAIWDDITMKVGTGATKAQYLDALDKVLKNSSGDSALNSGQSSGNLPSSVGSSSLTTYTGTGNIATAIITQLKTFTGDFDLVSGNSSDPNYINTVLTPAAGKITIVKDTIWTLDGTYRMDYDIIVPMGLMLIIDCGGSDSKILRTVTEDASVSTYKFVGWYDNNNNRYCADSVSTMKRQDWYKTDGVFPHNLNAGWGMYFVDYVPLFPKFVSAETSLCTISFDKNAGDAVLYTPSLKYVYGQTCDMLPNPTRSGYVFDGWYTDPSAGTEFTTSSAVNSDITLYAHWTEQTKYTVTWALNGGTVTISDVPHTEDIVWENVLPDTRLGDYSNAESMFGIVRDGYTFTGWKVGDIVKYRDNTVISDLTLTATWTQETTVRVTFDINTISGTGALGYVTEFINVESGSTLSQLPSPTKVGFKFSGWYDDKYLSNKITSLACSANTTLYAGWVTEYLISHIFETDGGNTGSVVSEVVRIVPQGSALGSINGDLPVPTPKSYSSNMGISVGKDAKLFVVGQEGTNSSLDGGNNIDTAQITVSKSSAFQGEVNTYLGYMYSQGLMSSRALIESNGGSVYLHGISLVNAYNWTGKRLGGQGGAILAASAGSEPYTYVSSCSFDMVAASIGGAIYQKAGGLYIHDTLFGHEGTSIDLSTTLDEDTSGNPKDSMPSNRISAGVGTGLIGCQAFTGQAIYTGAERNGSQTYYYGTNTVLDAVSIYGTNNLSCYDAHRAAPVTFVGNLSVIGYGVYKEILTTNGLFYMNGQPGDTLIIKDGLFMNLNAQFCGTVALPGGNGDNSNVLGLITGGAYINVNAEGSAAILYIRSGTGMILGADLSDSFSGSHGTAATVRASGTLRVENSSFTNCRCIGLTNDNGRGYGGALSVRLNASGKIAVNNCAFTGNESVRGGAISGSIGNYNTKIVLRNSTFDSNRAHLYGGDIYNITNKSNITILNCTFSGSIASNGASIYSSKGSITISNSTITGTTASGSGGAIYCASTVELIDSELKSNSAGVYGNNIYNIGNSTKTSIEGGSVVGGIYIESGTVESGKARGTVLDGLNVAAGTVRIGAYTTATDITVTSGNIYVANDNGDVKCAASGITLGSGKLYLGYNSKAQQVNMDLSTGELWLQKADTQDPPLNTTYFNKYEGDLNNIFNLKVINGVLQTPEVRLGTIAAAFTDSTHILLTITGSDHAPSTKSEVTVGSVLIVPDTWNQDALTSTTYTCTAVLGSAGCGFTEVNAITDSGYFNVYITISAATISTSIATSSIPASVHPSAGEGESYVDTGTSLSRSFVKMYQSDNNSTPSATNLELPILTDSAVKANFRGWDDGCASYLYDGVSLNIPYSLPAGGKVMITALWLNGNILNDYGIYYEYDSETKILTVAYDPDKKVGSVEPSPIMNATDAETLRTALGDDLQKVRKLVVTAITVLPGSAFSGYVSLSDVTLTGSGMGCLTNIGPSVFKGCSPDLKINLYDMDPSFTPILNLDILENSLLEAYRSTSIMLLDDIELTSTLNIGADTVMNLNGMTLSITSGYAFSLGSGVSITIADINPYGSGTVSIGANSYHVGSLYNTAEDSSHAKSSSVTLFAEDPVRAAKAEQIGSAGSTVMLIDAADRVEHKTYIGWSEEAQDTVPDCSDQSPIVLGSSGTTKNLYGVYRTTAFRASFTE